MKHYNPLALALAALPQIAILAVLALPGGAPLAADETIADIKADIVVAMTTKTEDAQYKDTNRERARRAQAEAASSAANSILTASKLDLDIRLVDPTSVARGQ